MLFVFKLLISAGVIAFASWLSGRYPTTAGFVVALPLTTMLVLPLSYTEHHNIETSFTLARSIFMAIPVTLFFFIPFLLSRRLGLSFWVAYAMACAILPLGFFAHRWATRAFL